MLWVWLVSDVEDGQIGSENEQNSYLTLNIHLPKTTLQQFYFRHDILLLFNSYLRVTEFKQ